MASRAIEVIDDSNTCKDKPEPDNSDRTFAHSSLLQEVDSDAMLLSLTTFAAVSLRICCIWLSMTEAATGRLCTSIMSILNATPLDQTITWRELGIVLISSRPSWATRVVASSSVSCLTSNFLPSLLAPTNWNTAGSVYTSARPLNSAAAAALWFLKGEGSTQAKLDSDKGPRSERRNDLKRTVAQFAALDSELKFPARRPNDCASVAWVAEKASANCLDAVASWILDTLTTSVMMAFKEGTG